jgi:hypothetical protein
LSLIIFLEISLAHGELAFCLQAHGGMVVYRCMEDKNESKKKKKGKVRWESGGGEVKREGGGYVGGGGKKKRERGEGENMKRE